MRTTICHNMRKFAHCYKVIGVRLSFNGGKVNRGRVGPPLGLDHRRVSPPPPSSQTPIPASQSGNG